MRWLREPLVHFLALGAGLFLLFALVGGSDEDRTDRIVISAAQVELLAEGFARTWQRPPTPAELKGLVDDHIREEIYYREAMAMGLDRDLVEGRHFGGLHGFGFAGALTEIGLPEQSVPLALLFFNVGVELGQLLFIAAVGLVVLAARRLPIPRPAWGWRVAAYGIGAVAAFWTIERVVGFWG